MKNGILIFAIALGFFLASCNAPTSENNSSTAPVPHKELTVKAADLSFKKDFVCEMDIDDETLADTTLYEGKLLGFCNVGCKEEFLKDPKKYIKE